MKLQYRITYWPITGRYYVKKKEGNWFTTTGWHPITEPCSDLSRSWDTKEEAEEWIRQDRACLTTKQIVVGEYE